MFSNIFITKLNGNESFDLKNNQNVNFYIVNNDKNDTQKYLNIKLKNNNKINIFCLVLSSNSKKEINFNIYHNGSKSCSNIFVKSLVNNNGLISINCISKAKEHTKKNEINQTIDGLMFDDKSFINALPCLDIDSDSIVAKHTVNIGQVDPEIIFYLNSKGLNTSQAYQFLIDSFLNDIKPFLNKFKINITKDINELLEAKYE